MLPLLRWNYTITSKHHSYSPSMSTFNIRIMIIFLIWYFILIKSLIHSFSFSIFIFLWIFILPILPLFRYLNSIIPKIITYCMIIIIFNIRIVIILFIRYLSIYSLYHSISLTIFISIFPFFRYF